MGHGVSKWDVIDWNPERNVSKEHRISAWEELEPKNSEYYDGTRFFRVSRNLYPSYTRGWIYGYNYDNDYWYDSLITPMDEY